MEMNITQKNCKNCHEQKSSSEFSKPNSVVCKSCYNKRASFYRMGLKSCEVCEQLKSLNGFFSKRICNDCSDKKRCHKCNTVKNVNDFYVGNKAIRSECISCYSERNKKIRTKYKESKPIITEKLCVNCNITKPIGLCCERKPYCKECYVIISKKLSKQYTIDNKDRYKKNGIEYRKKNPKKYMLSAAYHRAKKHNLTFEITENDIIIPDNCPVLGIPLKVGVGKIEDSSPSLDRIIPSLGYTKNNIMVISNRANLIKSFGSLDEHEKIVEYIKQNTPKNS